LRIKDHFLIVINLQKIPPLFYSILSLKFKIRLTSSFCSSLAPAFDLLVLLSAMAPPSGCLPLALPPSGGCCFNYTQRPRRFLLALFYLQYAFVCVCVFVLCLLWQSSGAVWQRKRNKKETTMERKGKSKSKAHLAQRDSGTLERAQL